LKGHKTGHAGIKIGTIKGMGAFVGGAGVKRKWAKQETKRRNVKKRMLKVNLSGTTKKETREIVK